MCYLRHVATNTVAAPSPNPHRPFSASELKRREQLLAYVEAVCEDQLIEEVLLPLSASLASIALPLPATKTRPSNTEKTSG